MASSAMSIRRRGMARLARRKAERRLAVFGCIRLFRLAVKRVPTQKWVVFFPLEPVRCARALLVARRHVTRHWFAQRFRFGAFESDNFLRHKIDNYSRTWSYSFVSTGAACSSSPSVSVASSSVRPKREVTDWRTREALLCFSSCDWHSTVKRAKGIASSRARRIGLPDISHLP